MAASVTYRTDAMADLSRQLAFAPQATTRRQVANAVALVGEIDPARDYPMAFVVFRVTGFRVDRTGDLLAAGGAIREDLCSFILEASRRAPRAAHPDAGAWVTISALAARWGVTERSLRRWRRWGLALEWSEGGRGRPELGVQESIAAAVGSAHAAELARAASCRILNPAERKEVVAGVRRERAKQRSLAAAHRVVARTMGITPEAVRLIWNALGASEQEPKRPSGWFARSAARGVPLAQLAASSGLGSAHASRRLLAERAQLLADAIPACTALPTFALADASAVFLGAPWLSAGLMGVPPTDALVAVVPHPRPRTQTDFVALAALSFLLWRARQGLGKSQARAAVEEAQRDARWAAMLLRTVVAWHTPMVLHVVGTMLGGPVTALPAEPLRSAVELAQRSIAGVALEVDLTSVAPERLRLDRLAQLAFEQRLARASWLVHAGRAAAVHDRPVAVCDGAAQAAPWVGTVASGCGLRHGALAVGGEPLRILAAHFGWNGDRPRSPTELAAGEGVTIQAMRHRLMRSANEARIAWRTIASRA